MNNQLAGFLQKHRAEIQQSSLACSSSTYHRRRWQIRDRLSRQDIADIISAFKAGTPKHVLAKRYNISLGSVKNLLRTQGIGRQI